MARIVRDQSRGIEAPDATWSRVETSLTPDRAERRSRTLVRDAEDDSAGRGNEEESDVPISDDVLVHGTQLLSWFGARLPVHEHTGIFTGSASANREFDRTSVLALTVQGRRSSAAARRDVARRRPITRRDRQ